MRFIKNNPVITILFVLAVFANLTITPFLSLAAGLTFAAYTLGPFFGYALGYGLTSFFNWMFFSEPVYRDPMVQAFPGINMDNIRNHTRDFTRDHYAVPIPDFAPAVDSSEEEEDEEEDDVSASADSEPKKELTEEELKEITDLTDALTPLLEDLTEDDILSMNNYVDPIIAGDLGVYDNTLDSYKGIQDVTGTTYNAYSRTFEQTIIVRNPSPITREALPGDPFPFSYVKLRELCKALNRPQNTPEKTLGKLLDLAICPVTKQIMQNPKIAHLRSTTGPYSPQDFVIVCDQSALDALPENFVLVKRIEYAKLQNITQHRLVGTRLTAALAALATPAESSVEDAWQAAFTQAQTEDFPSASTRLTTRRKPPRPGMFQPAAASSADHHSAASGARNGMG